MTISGTKQVFLNIIGLHPSESIHRFRYRLTVAIFASIMSAILLLSVWINFLLGVSTDISKTLILLPTATGLATVFCAHWHMLINRNRFYEFLTDMEELARKSMWTDHRQSNIFWKSIYSCLCFQGSTFNNNRRMYAEAQGSIDILIGRCIKAFIPIYVLHFIPLIIPIYDLLLGTYSIDSWIYFLPLWWVWPFYGSLHVNSEFELNVRRTPFEINTTLRCIAKELLIFIASTIACLPCWLIACMFIETDIYTKTFVRDIKRIFDRVNRLAWAKYPEHVMLTYCKEAIILHEQVYRWVLSTDIDEMRSITISIDLFAVVCIA